MNAVVLEPDALADSVKQSVKGALKKTKLSSSFNPDSSNFQAAPVADTAQVGLKQVGADTSIWRHALCFR